MSLPGLGPRRNPSDTARVKAMVAELIDTDHVTVLVTELACTEPGCPPVETVIALLSDGGNTQHKVHKPVAEVTLDDVRAALDGGTPHR
jgi:hypothetical protein